MGRPKKTKVIIISLILLAAAIWAAIFHLPDQKLHLVFCDVGQGDAILATWGSNQILIDAGPNNQVLECLANHLPFYDRHLEVIVLTHPDADHITGLVEVIKRYEVEQFVINTWASDTAVFKAFYDQVLTEKAAVWGPKAGDQFLVGPIKFRFFWPEDQPQVLGASTVKKEANEISLVSLLSYGNFDVFLSGDIGIDTEKRLAFDNLPAIEVLKVPHHGSKYSSGEAFLQAVKPALAVISVGKNSFGHPTNEVLQRLTSSGAKILRTDQDGEVEIISDGQTWSVAN